MSGKAKAPAKKAASGKKINQKKKQPKKVAPVPKRIRSGNEAGTFSYSSSLTADKRRAKRLFKQVLGQQKLQIGDFEAFIADGTVLLKVFQAVNPKAVAKINDKPNASQKKENLQQVVSAAKTLELPAVSVRDFQHGQIDKILRTLHALEAVAEKAGKFKPTQPKVQKSPAPVCSGISGNIRAKYAGKYSFYPAVFNTARPLIVPRQRYLNNIDLTALPEQFFVRVMAQAELQNGLVAIAFKQGLEKLQKGRRYIIGPRGDRESKQAAFSFLSFLGFKLVPTTESSGGHRVKVSKEKKPFLATLLKYYSSSAQKYLKA